MAILTKDQIQKIIDLIKLHTNWVSWRLLGLDYVTKEEIDRLKVSGILPMDTQINTTEYAFVLGKLEAFLKEAEWKKLSWEDLVKKVKTGLNDIQMMQVDAASLAAQGVFRGLESDIQRGLFSDLAVATQKTVNEGYIKDIIKDKIKFALEERKNYLKVADDLKESLKEPQRNWARVATTEMHNACQQGTVAAIVNKEEIYKYSEGEDSDAAVVPNPSACEDCKRLYLDKRTGHPQIFKLSELMANAGTNYVRPWRKNAKPVVPPLHPNCLCRVRYVPKGWGWNEKGRFTVIDKEKYQEKLKKSLEILRKSNNEGSHSLLQSSLASVNLPTVEDIQKITNRGEALKLADKLSKLTDFYSDDPDMYHYIQDLEQHTMYQVYVLNNGGIGEQADVSKQ